MGKLRVLSGSEVIAFLAEHGFIKVRQRGKSVSCGICIVRVAADGFVKPEKMLLVR